MTTPDPATCDSCPSLANGLDIHDNPTCGTAPCPPVNEFSLSVDVAADGTTTVDYTPPTSERCGRCGQVPDGWAYIGDTRYCHGGEVPTCYQLASFERTPPTSDSGETTCPEGTCDGCPEPDTCETLRRDIWPHRPPTPAVRDALHLVGLDLPREA